MDLGNLASMWRAELSLPIPLQDRAMPKIGQSVRIEIAQQPILKGWLEAINTRGDDHSLSVTVSGRDLAGDLVDCAAQAQGPGRMDKVRLEAVVGHLSQPFGLDVQSVVDTGPPFEMVAFDTSTKAIDVIEQQSRQRGVLVTSNGLGRLLLTKPGSTRAEENLIYPGGNVRAMEARITQRFSDHIVKGQGRPVHRAVQPALTADMAAGSITPVSGMSAHEERAVCQFGYCHDSGVGRYRPRVYTARTMSGQAPQASRSGDDLSALLAQSQRVQKPGYRQARAPQRPEAPPRTKDQPYSLDDQAAWRMRTSRAGATTFTYTVPSLTNTQGVLWRPNQIVHVRDRVNGLDGDMLIAGITWSINDHEMSTKLSVVPPDAYDLTGQADRTPHHGRSVRRGGLIRRRH
ncbi:Mu-like bacteriophage tail protein GpP [Saccharibacter floricola DSM 15669]|uniref:Mu-like bacteriophage tail protein GpP n=2 Tax=Saccharibacter TaxID=231052 RepID=A0ABQ0P1I7_9PROT|nr:Mu-like bacteriophage tail protein GpP [Saccharibacter floricola DSM 15669]